MEAIFMQVAFSALVEIIVKMGEKGGKKIKRVLIKDFLNQSVLEMLKHSEYKGFEIDELLQVMLQKQDQLCEQFSQLTQRLSLHTKVSMEGQELIISASSKDIEKISCIAEISKGYPDEKELAQLINSVKQYFNVVTPIKPKSKIFEEWFNANCGKKALFFEIDKSGYYSISRAQIYKTVPHEPRLYIVDIKDLTNFIYYEAIESQDLSDENNIVIKTNVDKGYIVAVGGTLV